MKTITVGVVGNPNCGKTTLFNALTGANQQVGNWAGVTVDKKVGYYRHENVEIELVDLPGIYSLDSHNSSLDEQVAQSYVMSGEAHVILNIIDASNLERNLYLTTQLLEMGVPLVVALNMMDVAQTRGIEIDVNKLEKKLGCPVLPLVAAQRTGIKTLQSTVNQVGQTHHFVQTQVTYPSALENALNQLRPQLHEALETAYQPYNRWIALKLLENTSVPSHCFKLAPPSANGEDALTRFVENQRTTLEEDLGDEVDILVADTRYGFINEITRDAVKKAGQVSHTFSDRLDRIVLNRALGIPIFLGVMYLMFMFTINIGGAFIDFFDQFVGALLVDGLGELLSSHGSPEWLVLILAKGVGGGVQTVATFIPIIGCLYLFLSFLEDSGYMARAAFVMDRFMRFIGLPGKSFVPMLVGFGCTVPAAMATRTLENRRDRILTAFMAHFVSCGARLPVYALFAAVFFPVGGQNVVFGLYLIGIAAAVFTGLVMKNTLLRGEPSPFVMELPPYHLPSVFGLFLRAWERLKGFIFKAGQIIIPMVVLISALNSLGTDGSFNNENTDKSLLSSIGRTMTPAFEPMGIKEENWAAMVGIFSGVLAKEVVVGTLDAIYSGLAEADHAAATGDSVNKTEEEPFNLSTALQGAFATIPANLAELSEKITDPLGISVGDLSDKEKVAETQEVHVGTFGAMASRFDGAAGAFAYLLFILMYFPCISATSAIARESSVGWAVFIGTWATGLGYTVSVIFYQLATYSAHPEQSLFWVGSLLSLLFLVVVGLRLYSQRQQPPTLSTATA